MTETTAQARGARLRGIREALNLTQSAFAERLTSAARALKLDATYDGLGVSQRETGRRTMDIEDYVIASHIDPAKRPLSWLAFGRGEPESVPKTPIIKERESERDITAHPAISKRAASGDRRKGR